MTYTANANLKQRDTAFDIARGIGIICIIAGHMGIAWISDFVFTFHVSLFFLISGYFYKYNNSIIRKYSKRLLLPYIFTVGVLALFECGKVVIKLILFGIGSVEDVINEALTWILAGLYGSGSRSDFLSFEISSIGAIWYLLALFEAICLISLLFKITSENSCGGGAKKTFNSVDKYNIFVFHRLYKRADNMASIVDSVSNGCLFICVSGLQIETKKYRF